jgi:hypothetical protein
MTNHIIIGLGGTGGRIIRSFRKTVYTEHRNVEPCHWDHVQEKFLPPVAKIAYLYADSNNHDIDSESVLKNQPEFNNNRCNVRAQARPFLSVPYMGGGRGNAEIETLLLHSEQVRMGKEAGTVTEQQFDGVFEPQIPSVKNNIQKPEHLITEMASPGWIRGGLPSRSYIRDVNC